MFKGLNPSAVLKHIKETNRYAQIIGMLGTLILLKPLFTHFFITSFGIATDKSATTNHIWRSRFVMRFRGKLHYTKPEVVVMFIVSGLRIDLWQKSDIFITKNYTIEYNIPNLLQLIN